MTGSLLFNRQVSMTAGTSNVDKAARRSLRRSSSVDSRHSMEPILDEKLHHPKGSVTKRRLRTENDSGTEDHEQSIRSPIDSPVQDREHNDDDDDTVCEEFGCCDDEGYGESAFVGSCGDTNIDLMQTIGRDLQLAAAIPHDEKKSFCPDNRYAFHAEFARLVAIPISLQFPGIRYHLFATEELQGAEIRESDFAFVGVDNAKAQFNCPACQRLWTSMRARVAFHVSPPHGNALVILKIFRQNCQVCNAPADARWYMEEVCRVMESFAATIFSRIFSMTIEPSHDQQAPPQFDRAPRRPHHNPSQRKGKMSAPHDSSQCEACQHGCCFPA